MPVALSAASAFVLAIAGLQSRVLADWWLENLVMAAFFVALAWSRRMREMLSPASLWMLFALLCLHEYGAAYAYASADVRAFRELVGGSSMVAVQSVLSTSAIYEMIEWLVAAAVDPSLGSEFVGAQGDDFDSAKDMAMAFCGAL